MNSQNISNTSLLHTPKPTFLASSLPPHLLCEYILPREDSDVTKVSQLEENDRT